MRVVLDTNVFVSMVLGGQVGKINEHWRATPTKKFLAVEADPADNKFVDAAVAAKADFVISGDAHLLDLKSFRSIPILTARTFIELLSV